MSNKGIVLVSMAFMVLCFFTRIYAQEAPQGITVTDAWVQAVPSVQTTTAAYMTITNDTDKPIVVVSAFSDSATAVEMHQMTSTAGMMHMTQVPRIVILAHTKLVLNPQGFHIMLINLKKKIDVGQNVSLVLHFQDGRLLHLQARGAMPPAEDGSSMAGMKM